MITSSSSNVGKAMPQTIPSHHHFYRWCKPFPVMGGKNGIVLHTLNSCKINIHLAHGVFTTIFAVQIPVYCTHTPSVSTRLRLIFLILFLSGLCTGFAFGQNNAEYLYIILKKMQRRSAIHSVSPCFSMFLHVSPFP